MRDVQHWADSEDRVLAYLAGELPGEESAAAMRHLNDCTRCRRRVVAEFEALQNEPAPSEQDGAQRARFEELLRTGELSPRRVSRRPLILLAAALSACVLLSIFMLRRIDSPGSIDAATQELLARVDAQLPASLHMPLWTPVSAQSRQPLRTLGDTEDAIDYDTLVAELESAAHEQPARVELRLALAHAQMASGNALAAELNYRQLIERGDSPSEARIGLAAALVAQGQLRDALAVLAEIPAQDALHRAALFDRALLHLELAEHEQTDRLIEDYRGRYGADPWLDELTLRRTRAGGS